MSEEKNKNKRVIYYVLKIECKLKQIKNNRM